MTLDKTWFEKKITSKPVVIFMKGTPEFPMCGFSSKACEILKQAGVKKEDLEPVNVLQDEKIRSGIKAFSNWLTLPQVFINGEFIGGSDILTELYESGALQEKIQTAKNALK